MSYHQSSQRWADHLEAGHLAKKQCEQVSDEIFIAKANTLTFRELNSFLCCHTDRPESGQNLDQPYTGLGYTARTATDVVGIFLFHLVPSIVPGEHLCFLIGAVDPPHRCQGLGSLLMTEVVMATRQAVNRAALIVSLPDHGVEPVMAFLGHFGFVEMDSEVHFKGNLVGIELEGKDPRFEACRYRGGNPLLNEAIIDLHRRSYRNEHFIADLTAELLTARLANPSCHYALLYRRGELAGYASFWINQRDCYVDSILVARRYWGCGASDALNHLIGRVAVKHGCETVSTICRNNNRAVNSLMNRHGCQVVKATRRFYKIIANQLSGA